MVEILKVYMNKETLVTLEDHFLDDEKQTLHRFFYENLRNLAKTSKNSETSRTILTNVFEDGQMNQKTFSYKDVDIEKYALNSNPVWRPEEIDQEDLAEFVMKVGEKTHKHLVNYCKILGARVAKYNNSLPLIKVTQNNEIVEKLDPRYKEMKFASCFEEIVHQALTEPIMRLLDKSAQELFDKENEEIEKAEKESEEETAPKAA